MLRAAAWDLGSSPAGPAMTVLRTLVARIAIILRAVALAEMLAQVVIWHSFYLARPWRLWAPAVALAWGIAAIACLRTRHPRWPLIAADSAVYTILALTAASCVPAAMRGEAGDWLFIVLASQVVTPIWFAPGALSVPLAAAPGVTFAAGVALAPPARLVTPVSRNASVVLLLVLITGNWLVRRRLCRRAVAADGALADADRDARDQYVILSRNVERREQDRLLHDTVLNTLTAIARSGREGTGSGSAAAGQCRQDIARLERATTDAAAGRPGVGRPGTGRPGEADPLAAIAAVIIEMRGRGLAVDLEITDAAAALVSVPAPIADAMAKATREALANVAAHAGTGHAWLTVSLTPPGTAGGVAGGSADGAAGGARPGQIQITIRDGGTGFAISRVASGRLGVRGSITERVEDSGGSASVRSAPGEGTTVCLTWPASSRTPAGPPATAAVAPDGAVADATESAAPRLLTTVAIALPAGLLVQALVSHASYRLPVVPVLVWLGMLAAAAWLAPPARAGQLRTGRAVAAVLVAAAAVTAIGLDRKVAGPAGTTVDWTILGTIWLLGLIALGSRARLWVPGTALIFGIHAIFVVRALGVSPLGLSRLAASAYAVVGILAVFAALRPALRTHAEIAVRRAALASQSAAERAAAAAISEVRREQLQLVEAEALPLLRGIADGTADPADSTVRAQCSQHAATIRRALADRRRPGAAGLLASLEPVLSAARSRRVPVEVQVIGDPGQPADDVAHATRAAADGVLRALRPQSTMLTAIASEDQVELFLTFERAPAAASEVAGLRHGVDGLRQDVRADAAWQAMLDVEDTGQGCLEVRWRKAVLA